MKPNLQFSRLLLIGATFIFGANNAAAQDYPNRPIRLIVPNSPGTVSDTVARIMSPEMSKALGQPIVVENKSGAGQRIGYEYVARQAPPDGYTVATVFVPSLALMPVIAKDLTFDPLRDLTPVIGVAESRWVLGSSPKMPWKNFKEFVDYAKANPGKLNYGSSTQIVQIWTEAVLREYGLNIVVIPFSAAAAYTQAIASGEVQLGLTGEPVVVSLGERFRALAATGAQRRAPFLDIPTFAELGLPQISGQSNSLNVRIGTSKAVIDTLYAAASRALKQPEVKAQFANVKLEIVEQTPEAAAKSLAQDAKVLATIAKQVGIQPE